MKGTARGQPANIELYALGALVRRELARRSLLEYLRRYPPSMPYVIGRHTEAMARELESVARAVWRGETARLILCCPPRHGKSDLAVRRLVPWYLGHRPDDDVIVATYAASLATSLSRDARRAVRDVEYPMIFGPDRVLSDEMSSVQDWGFRGHRGRCHAVGIGGPISGYGAHLLVIDDYMRGRAEAESRRMRDMVWDAYRSDLVTRLAPAAGVIIVATRWHEDDLVGRILREEPDKWRVVTFAAEGPDGWLFPERFAPEWYEAQKASVGSYAWAAQYQQSPVPRGGHMFRVERIEYYDTSVQATSWVRGWDLASTASERMSEDPDYTAGVRVGWDGSTIYVDDVVRGRWAAPERDRVIRETAIRDGPGTVQVVETVAGYRDAGEYIRRMLHGLAVVMTVAATGGDKVARASELEPLVEAGAVRVRRAQWAADFLAELAAFPSGAHDDQVDAWVMATRVARTRARQMRVELL